MIPFSPPRIDDKIIDEVIASLKSGWITTGPRTKEFERQLAAYCGVEKVLAINSWTAGAEMLLHWFGIQKGDEVIVPAYTYCATANIVVHCGAKVIMVDVNEDFTINLDKIKKAITPRTKAIIPVDVAGLPVDYDAIMSLVNEVEIKKQFTPNTERQNKLGRIMVLNDAAHSFGAFYKGKKVGNQCDFTVFSFHAVKNLTTAEGGAIAMNLPSPFNNTELYSELNTYSLHGQNKDALAKTQKGSWEYDVIDAGYKCNMTDILASIGLIELSRYDNDTLIRRREIVEKYNQLLSKNKWAIIPISKDENRESSYHLYLLRVEGITIEQRNDIIQKIFDKNVSVNVHYKPLPLLTAYKSRGYSLVDYPMSRALWENEISLPIFYSMTDEMVLEVVNAVVSSYNDVISIANSSNIL
jgi:dTDP-4-amino-4,6-dideoxygalactose transaminase